MKKRLREIERALSSRPTGGVRITEAEARRRKEIALAELHELRLGERRGELRPIAAINAYISGMIIEARDILLRIAPELADKLAQESDPIKCRELIEVEVKQALRKLAEYQPEGPNGKP